MLRNLILFLLCFSGLALNAQLIPLYWLEAGDIDQYYKLKNKKAKKIELSIQGEEFSGRSFSERKIYNFSDTGVIEGEYHKNKVLVYKFTLEFDSQGQLIRRIYDYDSGEIGFGKEEFRCVYEDGRMIAQEEYIDDSLRLDKIKYKYNHFGHPIDISVYDSLDQLKAYETANYLYSEGKYVHKTFNAWGQPESEEEVYFNTDSTQNEYNEFGDLEKTNINGAPPELKARFSFKYTYDEYGNWVKLKRKFSSKEKIFVVEQVKRTIEYEP